jgi:hypothetical protein
MRSRATLGLVMAIVSSSACVAQKWEVGGLGGYGWYHDATISSPAGSATIGITPKGAIGAVFGENLYKYVGGELRWMLIFGKPRINTNGIEVSRPGYSNVIHYDLLIHVTKKEARLRPFLAAGGGVRIYTATGRRDFNQVLTPFATLRPHSEAEGLISAGSGLKYIVTKGLQLRLDFRTYFTPAPKDLFRPIGSTSIHGWVYNFVSTLGVSYLF